MIPSTLCVEVLTSFCKTRESDDVNSQFQFQFQFLHFDKGIPSDQVHLNHSQGEKKSTASPLIPDTELGGGLGHEREKLANLSVNQEWQAPLNVLPNPEQSNRRLISQRVDHISGLLNTWKKVI